MISVIIPYWKRERELSRAINSLKNQTYKNFEVVVGEHKYPSIARNFGARKAKGEYLVFVDVDIVLNNNALEHYKNLMVSSPSCLIIGQYHWIPPEYQVLEVKGIIGNDPRCQNTALFDSSSLRDKYCLSFYGANFGLTKDLFFKIGEFDENIKGHGGEDFEFAIRLEKKGHKAIFSSEVVGFHYYHDRDQEKNKKEVDENIKYILKKHNIDELGIRKGKEGELPLVYKDKNHV